MQLDVVADHISSMSYCGRGCCPAAELVRSSNPAVDLRPTDINLTPGTLGPHDRTRSRLILRCISADRH